MFIFRLKLIFNKFDEAARNGDMKDEGKYYNIIIIQHLNRNDE